MMGESVEIDVQKVIGEDPNKYSFIWVLRLTKPVRPLFRSLTIFATRAEAYADWEDKKEAFKKAWELMSDDN